MTYLLDTSALLAHYFAEPGAARVQELLGNERQAVSTSVLALFEFELRLSHLGLDAPRRAAELNRYRALLDEVADVNEVVRAEAIRLRTEATARVSSMDVLIAATASLRNATLIHRDPHFASIPAHLLKQEGLSAR